MDISTKRNKLLTLQKKLQKIYSQESELKYSIHRAERKLRTRKLIETGAIFEKVGLLNYDREFLIGFLLDVKLIQVDSNMYKQYKNIGAEFLKKNKNI